MEIREMTGDSPEMQMLEAINDEAIPEDERCALRDMLATGAAVWCIDAEGEPAGYMAVRQDPNLVYLAFFAVRSDLRSKGIGGNAVRELIRRNPDKQVIVTRGSGASGSISGTVFTRRDGIPATTTWSLKSAARPRILTRKGSKPSRPVLRRLCRTIFPIRSGKYKPGGCRNTPG